jgi:hypothetical protein
VTATLHWEVLAVVELEPARVTGLAGPLGATERCGHNHASDDEAYACPWTPAPWPEVCDLFVRQVRTQVPLIQLGFPWARIAGRRAR